MYKDASVSGYLDDLAARLPAPGGGSAAALAAAMGVSLLSMVVNFTLGKPKYARYEKELRKSLEVSEALRKEFLNLVDLDVIAYKSRNLKDALHIPFMVCRLCFEAMKLCPPLIKKGNVNLISDVAVAAVLLESAFACAGLNVEINLKQIEDKRIGREMRKELNRKYRSMKKVRSHTEVKVGKIIRG